MRLRLLIPLVTFIFIVTIPSSGVARLVHDFDCAQCHKPGSTLTSVGNIVCLGCHDGTKKGTTYPLLKTGPGPTNPIGDNSFIVGDASDALGSVTAQGGTPLAQTSHNWAAADENAAAGATAPSNMYFYGRQNYSGATVNCGRCHDPHGFKDDDRGAGSANPKLLKLGPNTEIQMCNDCHVSWASDTAQSEGGSAPTNVHPMVTDYGVVISQPANSGKYNSVGDVALAPGEVALNGAGGIDCLTCHGVHFTDSDASTLDGVQAGSLGHLNPGGTSKGKILRANGSAFDEAGVASNVSICQTCHTYKDHGSGRTNPIGCLICHGAHLEDTGGSMNNYMLRSSVTTYMPNGGGTGTASPLTANITDTPAQNTRLWNYCFGCHVEASAAITHISSWTCSDCHSHGDTDGSWTAAGGCNTCHGYPPSEAVAANGSNNGYAVQSAAKLFRNYKDDSGHYKDESTTQHSVHAGGGTDYSFRCSICHKNNDHIGENYADVFLAPMDALIDDGGNLSSTYQTAVGGGTCSAVYCHSNGGPRGAIPTVNDPGGWSGGAAISTCDACHGNDATDMATRNNSATHIAHLDKGYNCQVCHADTATSASALVAAAKEANGVHVNGDADVAFDATSLSFALGATSYGADGTCSVYCHSNGTSNVSPDWDLSASGACGTCHQYDNAGVATGSGAALGGAHNAHVFAASGPQLACIICHTHDGSTGAANTDHVNGTIEKVTNYMDVVCNPCHGSTNGGSGDDAEPVWTTPASVSCETCHSGSVIATINFAAPDKSNFTTTGHGKTGVTQSCSNCHNAAADNNHLGALGDTDRLRTDLGATYNASSAKTYCSVCHDGGTGDEDNHYANSNSVGATDTSTDGNNCVICHDPHGQQDKYSADLDAMLRATIGGRAVTGFSDKTDRTKYYNTVDIGEGVCQTCHDPNEVNNFNRTTANTGHGGTGVCSSCHPHTTTPAFKASCNGCHGNVGTGQYWPFGSGGNIPTANDEVGEHPVHVLAIGLELGYGSDTSAYDDTQQKNICEFCHAGTANDGDHGLVGSLDADVFVDSDATRHAKSLWGANDPDAAYNNGADTCSNIDCHNGKLTVDDSYGWHDGASNPGCILCHNDMTNTGIATGQTHSAHTGASTLYGATINCASCHDAATNWSTKTKPASNHIDGTFDIGGTVSLTYDGTFGTSFGSCGTNACHENGTGGAPADNGYTWGTAEASACGICHSATPTSGDHTVHLSGTYGPSLGTDCSGCHAANANNTSMAGKSTHINGTVTFTDGGSAFEVANGDIDDGSNTIDDCDACHGGATAANIAKGYWFTATRVSCESCHGDYTAAVIGGVTAPSRAGTAWDATGHGKYGFPKCDFCHLKNSAHISGSLNDDNRLLVPGASDYDVLGQRNGYCNTCHATTMNVHFSGGTSTDALYCVSCHDPHGQSGFDAMVNSSVGGSTVGDGTRTVAGFTDRTDRTTYRNASFTGICQTCHASAEVDYFDQDTEDANLTHNPGSNCISCHAHTATPAFKASCNSCHGDAGSGRYWPDDGPATQVPTADQAGRHEKHIIQLASEVMGQTITQLLNDDDGPLGPWNPATSDAKQKALCEYCHAATTNDTDHGAASTAEVFVAAGGGRHAKAIWGAADANATYNANDTCSTTACHNNQTTTDGTYGWYDAGTSECVMCHVDVPNDATSHTIHTGGSWNFACSVCHAGTPTWTDGANGTQSAPSTGHMNGIMAISGSRTFSYNSGTGSCDTNECHNNGNMGAPVFSGYDWDAGKTNVSACDTCHGLPMTSNDHATHSKANATGNGTKQFVQNAIGCSDCHDYSVANHLNGAISFKVGMNYSGNTAINDGGAFGSCDTTTCHNDGSVAVVTPTWDNASSTADDCTICHAAVPATGSHSKHVKNTYVPSDYTNTTAATTATDYIFACSDCHGSTIGNHIDTTKDLDGGLGWSASTCTTSYCHSDGNGSYTPSPNWNAGTFPADKCAGCHGNSPTSNAHQSHQVGIHFDTLYAGTSGLLATGNTEPSAHGARWGDGTTGTSTVISCHICHFDTINVWYNDQNPTCSAVSCHDSAPRLKGDASVTDKRKHVDGNKDVAFQAIKVASKAQLRNDITTVPEVDANWERIKPDGVWAAIVGLFYKENDSFDRAKNALDTATMFNGGTTTCSNIACHNGFDVTWAVPTGDCSSCHTTVSQ